MSHRRNDKRHGRARGSASRRRSGAGAQASPGETTSGGKRRRDLSGAAADLPNWVVDELARVTPSNRVGPALLELGEASAALSDGRYHRAVKHAQAAKELAPQDATVRETLGIASYRTGDWATALRELRTYRRMTGDTTHLPVEIDVLRALGRAEDVEKAFQELTDRGGHPAVVKEGIVVFSSHLIDEGEPERALQLTLPNKITPNPHEADLRIWYVAARAAALLGDGATARRLADAIVVADPAFPGLDDLDKLVAAAG